MKEIGRKKDTVKDTVKSNNKAANIIKLIRKNPSIIIKELSEQIGINQRNLKRYIAKLKENGFIKREGSDKTGFWRVLK